MTKLYTFWISHFSEKARFCLDYEGVSFRECPLLPGPHALTIRRLARRHTVPVLVHEGKAIQGSRNIVDAIPELFKKTRLQPWLGGGPVAAKSQQRAVELERLADDSFGRPIQAFGYQQLLESRETVVGAWNFRGPFWGWAFYAVAFPLLERAIRTGYCQSPAHVEESRQKFLRALDETDRLLEKQPYLLGDHLTRPDVVVAALLSPLVRPPEYVMGWVRYPPELEEFARSQSGRPTWSFVSEMYRDHR
jgi:glutathione S-transferase